MLLTHFWDDEHGMVVEQWDETFSTLDGYRGVNANMHTVEALLSAADVLDEPSLRERALRIVTRVVHDLARGNAVADPRALRRHLDAGAGLQRRRAGAPVPPVRRDDRALARVGPAGAAPPCRRSATRPRRGCSTTRGRCSTPSVREGWAVDGADGFVYTVDWSGAPVVRERMHWVAAEATATAAALYAATGDPSYAEWYATWWQHVADCFVDREHGSWRHELSPAEPAEQRDLEGEAGHLPRVPGHVDPAVAAVPDPGRGPAATACSADPGRPPVTRARRRDR